MLNYNNDILNEDAIDYKSLNEDSETGREFLEARTT
jgi:hypothetical protein